MNKKYDNVFPPHSKILKLANPILKNLITLHFLIPQARDSHCSLKIMLRTKLTHTYT